MRSLKAQQTWTFLSSCVLSNHTMHTTKSGRQHDVVSKHAPHVQEHEGTAPRLRLAAALCRPSQRGQRRSPSGTSEVNILFAVDISRDAEPLVRDIELYAFCKQAIGRLRFRLKTTLRVLASMVHQPAYSTRIAAIHIAMSLDIAKQLPFILPWVPVGT